MVLDVQDGKRYRVLKAGTLRYVEQDDESHWTDTTVSLRAGDVLTCVGRGVLPGADDGIEVDLFRMANPFTQQLVVGEFQPNKDGLVQVGSMEAV